MSDVPPKIQELISTPTRKEIFDTIVNQKDGFTFFDVLRTLENNNINVSLTSVQNLVKALSFRGYLEEYTLKDSKTAGRSTIHFKKSRGS